jgi:hypothetical protein
MKKNINNLKYKKSIKFFIISIIILSIIYFLYYKKYLKYKNNNYSIEKYENNNINNINNEFKTCFIITGFLEKKYVDKLLETYKNNSDKIISTWNDQDKELIDILKLNNFIIVQTEKPEIEISSNLQSIAIMNGINKAKELGFTHAIRTRSDLECNNITLFKNIIINKYLQDNKFACLTGLNTSDGIYFFDFIISGNLDQLSNFFSNLNIKNKRYDFPEKFWVQSYLKKNEDISKDDIKQLFNFFINDCKENNISFIWLKTNENILESSIVVNNGWI